MAANEQTSRKGRSNMRTSQLVTAGPGRVAAIYARLSSTHDSHKKAAKTEQGVETSLDTQVAGCKRHAASLKVKVAEVFTERYTGAELHMRPVLGDLRTRIRAGEFSHLIVYSDDRLARDPLHIALVWDECDRAECELVFVTSTLENTDEGRLIAYVRGFASKLERVRIKDRMMRARMAIIAAGKMTGQGFSLYGYNFDPVNRVRVIDEETAPIVRDIFRWLDKDSMSLRAVRDRLESMRIPCPADNAGLRRKEKPTWSTSSLARMVHNEAYVGITQVLKTRATNIRISATGKNKQADVEKKDWKVLPDGVTPAIIDRATFDRVQVKLTNARKRSDYTRQSTRPVLLRGLLYCGECGSVMYPMSETTHKPVNPKQAVYRCSDKRRLLRATDRRRTLCSAKRLIAADIEDRTWTKIVSFLLEPSLVEREVKKVLSTSPDDHLVSDLAGAKKQHEAARRVRESALVKFEDAIADDDQDLAERWDKKAKSANSDVRALAAVVKQLEAKLAGYNNAGKTAKAFAKQVREIVDMKPTDFSFEAKRAALESLAVRVYACACHDIKIELNTGILADQVEHPVSIEVRA